MGRKGTVCSEPILQQMFSHLNCACSLLALRSTKVNSKCIHHDPLTCQPAEPLILRDVHMGSIPCNSSIVSASSRDQIEAGYSFLETVQSCAPLCCLALWFRLSDRNLTVLVFNNPVDRAGIHCGVCSLSINLSADHGAVFRTGSRSCNISGRSTLLLVQESSFTALQLGNQAGLPVYRPKSDGPSDTGPSP